MRKDSQNTWGMGQKQNLHSVQILIETMLNIYIVYMTYNML